MLCPHVSSSHDVEWVSWNIPVFYGNESKYVHPLSVDRWQNAITFLCFLRGHSSGVQIKFEIATNLFKGKRNMTHGKTPVKYQATKICYNSRSHVHNEFVPVITTWGGIKSQDYVQPFK